VDYVYEWVKPKTFKIGINASTFSVQHYRVNAMIFVSTSGEPVQVGHNVHLWTVVSVT
jgi:hypothetical protein